MGFKLTYADLSNFNFQKAMQKIENAPTDGFTAYRINKIVRDLKKGRDQISAEYRKDIMEVFAKKDENGKYDENTFQPMEDKIEEFKIAQEAFGKKELHIEQNSLSIADIKDIKISAAEMDALKGAFDDTDMEKKELKSLMNVVKG